MKAHSIPKQVEFVVWDGTNDKELKDLLGSAALISKNRDILKIKPLLVSIDKTRWLSKDEVVVKTESGEWDVYDAKSFSSLFFVESVDDA